MEHRKWPRTFHCPWSPGTHSDDRLLADCDHLVGMEVSVQIKMDGEGCLSGETEVLTEFGKKTIAELCEAQLSCKVATFDVVKEEIEYQPIKAHSILEPEGDWFEVELEDGVMLRITGNHKVWLPQLQCYRRVCDLKEGDEFLTLEEINS